MHIYLNFLTFQPLPSQMSQPSQTYKDRKSTSFGKFKEVELSKPDKLYLFLEEKLQSLFTIHVCVLIILVGKSVERLIWFAPTEFPRINGISPKVVGNSQTEYPRETGRTIFFFYHSQVEINGLTQLDFWFPILERHCLLFGNTIKFSSQIRRNQQIWKTVNSNSSTFVCR